MAEPLFYESMSKKQKIFLFVVISVFMVFLFGFKDICILFSKEWPHLYSVVGNNTLTWDEIYGYLPFANQFSLANPLPITPVIDFQNSAFSFYPPITFVFQGILFKYIFSSNIDMCLLFSHIFFPLISFWLIYLIFRNYLSISWSILFAFWGVMFLRSFSVLKYFGHIFLSPFDIISKASLFPSEITRTPIPCFTFFFFILTFYFSIRTYKISRKRYLFLSLLWALNIYVYIFNFIAGVMFWLVYILFTRYIQDRRLNVGLMLRTLLENIALILLVISPLLIKRFFFSTDLDLEFYNRLQFMTAAAGIKINEWGFFVSYILPLLCVWAVMSLYCSDYYEFFYKFTPVIILIFVEISVLNLHLLFGRFFETYLFSLRIGNFFFRFLYFIPFIYFFSNPPKVLFHNAALNNVRIAIHNIVNRYLIGGRRIIVIIGILSIGFLSLASSIKFVQYHEKYTAKRASAVQEKFDSLISIAKESNIGGTLVSDDIAVNLLLPVRSNYPSLLVSSFNNYVREEEILRRLILYAKIFKWDEQRFLNFMMPNSDCKDFHSKNDFIVSDKFLNNGFGYWLLKHQRIMSQQELKEYKKNLLETFSSFNFIEALKGYKVTLIQSQDKVNHLIPFEKVIPSDDKINYYLLLGS